MTTKEIADKLAKLCSQGKFAEATEALYSPDIVSVEAGAPPGQSRESKGIDAVRKAERRKTDTAHVVFPVRARSFEHFARDLPADRLRLYRSRSTRSSSFDPGEVPKSNCTRFIADEF